MMSRSSRGNAVTKCRMRMASKIRPSLDLEARVSLTFFRSHGAHRSFRDGETRGPVLARTGRVLQCARGRGHAFRDRKSTRLNSSHLVISYAVFCLKKKNKHPFTLRTAQ